MTSSMHKTSLVGCKACGMSVVNFNSWQIILQPIAREVFPLSMMGIIPVADSQGNRK